MRVRYAWLLCLVGCSDPAPKTPPPAPPPKAPPTVAATPDRSTPPLPTDEVKQLCAAIHTRPRERRAECCNTKLSFTLQPECERRLQTIVGQRTIELTKDLVDRCTDKIERVLAGCDWVGPHWLVLPEECLNLVKGRLQAGQSCRTHLACQPGLFCSGLTTDGAGTCQKPKPIGASCEFGPDTLATVLQQDVKEKHPPCADGYCRLGKCVAFSSLNSPCGAKDGCGPDARCVNGLCVAGRLGQRGEGCTIGRCSPGLRCIAQRCEPPKAPGARCGNNEDCFGTCEKGRCAMTCSGRIIARPLSRP